jgi:hypothetical protein
MAAYNVERYVGEAVESVLAQTFSDFELVVVDDGSTDSTPAILDRYTAEDSRIRVIRQRNAGMVTALNVGCGVARGALIARLDADDVALPDRLAHQVAFLCDNQDHGLVGGGSIKTDRDGREIARVSYPTTDAEVKRSLTSTCPFEHSAVTMRAEGLRALGGYREAFASVADYDLWLRFSERWCLTNLASPVVRYRIHPAQMSVSSIHALAVLTVAAQRAHAARRGGHSDPTEGVREITPQVLESLGIGADDVTRGVVTTACWYAKTMARAGCPRVANDLWEVALSEAAASPASLELVSEVERMRAASEEEKQGALSRALAALPKLLGGRPGPRS